MEKQKSKMGVEAQTVYLRLPVKLCLRHFDRGVHCVSIVDAGGRTVAESVAEDDACELAQALNCLGALLKELQSVADASPHTAIAHYLENWPKVRAAFAAQGGVK